VQFDASRGKLRAALAPKAEEIAMTMAEQLRAEGRIEGRAAGLAGVLRRLLVVKFGAVDAEHEARIRAATPDQLDRFLDRVLIADTLAAVFTE
jgi:hypothetical protein